MGGKEPAFPDFPIEKYGKSHECPLFVTFNRNDVLRGCIGCLEPLVLCTGLKDYTLKAGLYDSRFDALTLNDLKDESLTC